jgi:dolichol-phosphate mannosyltransferase
MLLATAQRDRTDLVVASRYCEQGRAERLGPIRSLTSTASSSTARMLFPWRLRGVTDPMSGFFLVRLDAIDLDTLRPRGFKILLELLARCHALRRAEVGFMFADRHAEESKGSLGLRMPSRSSRYCRRPEAARPAVATDRHRSRRYPEGNKRRAFTALPPDFDLP